ncbi:MAG: putative serine/threonine phosphatase [Phycisphaerales bacterium]|nr:putative serine/threonine phosphatase [Phycisphaerales bacterium]
MHSLGLKSSLRFLLLFIALAPTTGPIQAAEKRDWKAHPAIVELDAPHDLYALGDVHGDYDRLVELLVAGKIIAEAPATPEAAHWVAGPAVLVVTGDFIDKGTHALPVIALFRTLEDQATKAGGRLIVTLGNHEAEFLANPDGRNRAEFTEELRTAGISPAEVAEGKDAAGIGAWLRNLSAGAKVGDWFFCHAGNTGGRTLAELRAELERDIDQKGFGAAILFDPNSMLMARMRPRPWWEADVRPAALRDVNAATTKGANESGEQRLRAGIEALGAKHLVFGHQPGQIKFSDGTVRDAGDVYAKYDGLVFLIDTGMSRGAAGGRGALLHIEPGDPRPTATAVYADGKTNVIWK